MYIDNMLKNKIKVMSKVKSLLLISIFLYSCNTDDYISLNPCINDNCEYTVNIDKVVNPDYYLDENGFHHIVFNGLKYFTIETNMSPLKEEHVINGTPMVEVRYDSDKWVVFDSISFTIPTYSYLGVFKDKSFENPIPVGDTTITLTNMDFPPFNIVGYSINENINLDNPYTDLSLGVKNKYDYNSRRMIHIDEYLVGDTVNIVMELQWNIDIGTTVVKEHKLKVIIE